MSIESAEQQIRLMKSKSMSYCSGVVNYMCSQSFSQFLFSRIIKVRREPAAFVPLSSSVSLHSSRRGIITHEPRAISLEPPRPSSGTFYYAVGTWPAITFAPFRGPWLRDEGRDQDSLCSRATRTQLPTSLYRFIKIEICTSESCLALIILFQFFLPGIDFQGREWE